ncbi:hypothetical protein [Cutibacterium avidum]|nr:hypothetical protein [Cutibacterium avidum]MDY0818863.1 hypothetical protein [Cutibacterium avidum]
MNTTPAINSPSFSGVTQSDDSSVWSLSMSITTQSEEMKPAEERRSPV